MTSLILPNLATSQDKQVLGPCGPGPVCRVQSTRNQSNLTEDLYMSITFQEFVASRRYSSNLARDLNDSCLFDADESAITGYIYMDSCYIFINDNGDAELILGNEDIIDDLDKLEEELFQWYLVNH